MPEPLNLPPLPDWVDLDEVDGIPRVPVGQGRSFDQLLSEGVLWAINVHVFHPRGFALALHFDDENGEATGWSIMGDGTEPWVMQDGPGNCAKFSAFEGLLSGARKRDVPGYGQDAPEWTIR